MTGTPFFPREAPLNTHGRWYRWDRHIIPDLYSDLHSEVTALRTSAAAFDMSAMTLTMVSGRDASRLVNHVVTREMGSLNVNQMYYTAWCDDRGKVIFEGPVLRLEDDVYCLTGQPQDEWITQQAEGFDVAVSTRSTGNLALQGPKAREILEAATRTDWSHLKLSRIQDLDFQGAPIKVMRMGFTGEFGYEIWADGDAALRLWDVLFEMGPPLGLRPAGHYTHDVARVEAGFILVGAEYTGAGPERPSVHCPQLPEDQSSPFELGIGGVVDFSKPTFVGREALVKEQDQGGPRYQLVGLELQWHDMVQIYEQYGTPAQPSARVQRCRLPLRSETEVVGRATSLTWSPTLKRMIGFGNVRRDLARAGTRLLVEWSIAGSPQLVRATVTELPFLKRRSAAPTV